MEIAGWLWSISGVFIVLSLYFTLSFIEGLKKSEERVTKQSKAAAIICLGLALFIPAITSLVM